jgi:hypothetical protein
MALVLRTGDVVRAVVRKTTVFGLFCECETHEILVLIWTSEPPPSPRCQRGKINSSGASGRMR